jgi:hypothetical protein
MGIKDWFGGGKKAEFREKAKEVLSEGRLKPGKADKLMELSKVHEIESPGDDKTMLRREIYNKAVGSVKAAGKLTEVEAGELAKIQKFLELRDDQVEKTQWDLARLRTLTAIRQGNLPTVPASNVALRGIPLESGEVAHYAVPVEAFDAPSTSGQDGVAAQWGKPYRVLSAKSHSLPLANAKAVGEGYLILTSKRLFFKGAARSAAVAYSPQSAVFLYGDGIRLERTVGHTLLKFKSTSPDTAEIVGELLAALMK